MLPNLGTNVLYSGLNKCGDKIVRAGVGWNVTATLKITKCSFYVRPTVRIHDVLSHDVLSHERLSHYFFHISWRMLFFKILKKRTIIIFTFYRMGSIITLALLSHWHYFWLGTIIKFIRLLLANCIRFLLSIDSELTANTWVKPTDL